MNQYNDVIIHKLVV